MTTGVLTQHFLLLYSLLLLLLNA